MDISLFIIQAIKKELAQYTPAILEIDIVCDELLPSVLTFFMSDHEELLRNKSGLFTDNTEATLFYDPLLAEALRTSVQKTCAIFTTSYSENIVASKVNTVIENDVSTLLANISDNASATWEKLKEKTHDELLALSHAGSKEERIFLWLKEIQKSTGVSPDVHESAAEYSARAIGSFLKRDA